MLLKKYLHRLSELSDLKLLFVRYFVNVIVLLEVLLVPLALAPDFYTEVEFLRYSFMIVPVFLLGSYSGYLHVFYNKKVDYKVAMIGYSVLIALICGVIAYFIFQSIIAALAIFFVIMVLPLEKVLITKKQMILASVYKSMISTVMIIICFVLYFSQAKWAAINAYSTAVILGSAAWIAFLWRMEPVSNAIKALLAAPMEHMRQFGEISRQGFILNVQSYILVGYFLFDRYITNNHFADYAPEFAIAFSLSQIVFIGINTIAFSAQQKVGSEIDTLTRADYVRYLKITSGLFGALLAAGFVCVFIFSFILQGYGQFYYSFIIVAGVVGGYYLLSSFSVVAFYKGLSLQMFLILTSVLLVNMALSWVVLEQDMNYYVNLVKSVVLLLLAGVLTDQMTRRVLS